MKIVYCITGLNKGGAEKILVHLVINNLLREKYTPVVVSIIGGYYESILKNNDIKSFILFKNKKIGYILRCCALICNRKQETNLSDTFVPFSWWIGCCFY